MKTLTAMLGLALAALLATTAHAQYSIVGTSTSVNFYDAAYDYDVYLALPSTSTGWYLLWTYPDGTTELDGPFATRDAAQTHQFLMNWHGLDPRGGYLQAGNIPSYEIFEGPKTPNWQFYRRCGTRAAAEDTAEWLRSFGLLADIRRVSAIKYKLY